MFCCTLSLEISDHSTLWVHAECFLLTNSAVVCNLLNRCVLKSHDALDLWRRTLVWGIYFQSQPRTSCLVVRCQNIICSIKERALEAMLESICFVCESIKKRTWWDLQVQSGSATVYFQLYLLTNCTYWQIICCYSPAALHEGNPILLGFQKHSSVFHEGGVIIMLDRAQVIIEGEHGWVFFSK